ncbi:MAG: hypothetical protein U1F67_10790 [Rubrivivax sp.]
MPTPRARHIPQLLDIHAEDLAFLWSQRREAIDSPEQTLRDFAGLTERIEAHIQGLLVAPPGALVARLQAALENGDRDDIFAAAIAALRCGDAAAASGVIAEFSRASGAALLGLRDALGQAGGSRVAGELSNALTNAKPAVAAAAAVALANHKRLAPDAPGLERLLLAEDGARSARKPGLLRGEPIATRQPRRPQRRRQRHVPAARHALPRSARAARSSHPPRSVGQRRVVGLRASDHAAAQGHGRR